jgi:hypothetical protein
MYEEMEINERGQHNRANCGRINIVVGHNMVVALACVSSILDSSWNRRDLCRSIHRKNELRFFS